MVDTAEQAQSLSDLGSADGGLGPDADRPRGVAGLLMGASFVIGSAALLAAMCADTVAVIGRHLGTPFLGSIEIVQACIVVAASSAMIGATVSCTHAAVHILTERLRPGPRALLKRVSNLFGAVFFGCLFVGSAWLISDLWGGHERTELLHLPLAPLRLFWCASAGLILLLFLARAILPGKKGVSDGA